jgi:hypothetical protein
VSGTSARSRLPSKAYAYFSVVTLAATGAAVRAFLGFGHSTGHWGTFAGLAAGAALAQLLLVEIDHNHGFAVALVFLVAAALLLPPELVALMGLAQHAPDLLRRRYPGYIQTFNVANYTLNALAAWAIARLLSEHVLSHDRLGWAVAGLAAATTFVALNHLLLATMLRLARGHSFHASRLFAPESVTIDLVLATLGVAIAAFVHSNPTLVLTAVAPLFLLDRFLRLLASAPNPTRTA